MFIMKTNLLEALSLSNIDVLSSEQVSMIKGGTGCRRTRRPKCRVRRPKCHRSRSRSCGSSSSSSSSSVCNPPVVIGGGV